MVVDIFGPERVKLEEQEQEEGFQLLSRFLCQTQKGKQDDYTEYFIDALVEGEADDEEMQN